MIILAAWMRRNNPNVVPTCVRANIKLTNTLALTIPQISYSRLFQRLVFGDRAGRRRFIEILAVQISPFWGGAKFQIDCRCAGGFRGWDHLVMSPQPQYC